MSFGYVIVWTNNDSDHGRMYCEEHHCRDPWTNDADEATVFASEESARNFLCQSMVHHWDGRTKIVPLRAPTPKWAKRKRVGPPSKYELNSLAELREARKTKPWVNYA